MYMTMTSLFPKMDLSDDCYVDVNKLFSLESFWLVLTGVFLTVKCEQWVDSKTDRTAECNP